MQVLINDLNDITAQVDLESITIRDSGRPTGDNFTFSTLPVSRRDEIIVPGNKVELNVGGEVVFRGVITEVSVERVSTDPTKPIRLNVSANDLTFYLNRRLVVKDRYPAQDASERVKAILYEFAPEFSDPLFIWSPSGTQLDAEVYKYETVASAIDRIARAADFVWFIDAVGYVHFVPSGQAPAPISTIDFDQTTEVWDLSISWDVNNLANVIIATDWTKKGERQWRSTYNFDGKTLFYPLPMEPFDLTNFKAEYSTDDGQTWIPLVVEGDPLNARDESFQGIDDRCYVCIFNVGIRLPEVTKVPPNSIIKVEYDYVEPEQAAIFEDPYSIAEFARRENSHGRHEALMSLPDVRAPSYQQVETYARGVLEERAWPVITGSFKTDVNGFRPFQWIEIYSATYGIYDMKKKLARGVQVPIRVWVTDVAARPAGFFDDGEVRFEYTVNFSSVKRF